MKVFPNKMIHIPVSSKGVKFVPLKHQKQTWAGGWNLTSLCRFISFPNILRWSTGIVTLVTLNFGEDFSEKKQGTCYIIMID